MTTSTSAAGLRPMRPRDPRESHRAASTLELFFDLVFVVAVGFASSTLHHIEADGHVITGVAAYLLVFFAIWWAWMNFTWFATAFDTDDWLYRVTTIVQMAGVLVLAAGIGPAMQHGDYLVATLGYVVMRLAMTSQWLRAARAAPTARAAAIRYGVGIIVVQVFWVLRVTAMPESWRLVTFLVLAVAELAVPVVAEWGHRLPFHAGHIAERYGLFTLIVLGEGLVASANAVIDAIAHTEHIAVLLGIGATGLVIVASLWWIYFSREHADGLTTPAAAFRDGYGHYVLFAAAAAIPAGIEVLVAWTAGDTALSHGVAAATVTVPVAVFVVAVWALALRATLRPPASALVVASGVAIGAAALLPEVALLLAAVLLAAVVVLVQVARQPGRSRPWVPRVGSAIGTGTTPLLQQDDVREH